MYLYLCLFASVAVSCSALVLPLFSDVSKGTQKLVGSLGLTCLAASLCALFDSAPLEIAASLAFGFALVEVRKAWRRFDDARMVRRAEAYQAKIDARHGL